MPSFFVLSVSLGCRRTISRTDQPMVVEGEPSDNRGRRRRDRLADDRSFSQRFAVVAEALLSDAPPQTRRRPQRRQDRQRVRAVDRNHPKGKTSKLTELGKMVRLQEAENQIITAHEGYVRRPADNDILIDAIDRARLGRAPRLVSADAAGHSSIIGSPCGAPQIRVAGRHCCLNGASVFEFLRHIGLVGFG
jgi:hypothetical protein